MVLRLLVQVGLREVKYMLLVEFVIVAVPCELNQSLFLPPQTYTCNGEIDKSMIQHN